MNLKAKKWIKRHITPYNIAIVCMAIMTIVSLIIVIMPSKNQDNNENSSNNTTTFETINTNTENTNNSNVSSDETNTNAISEDSITEEVARAIAVNKFKELNETIEANQLNVVPIERNGENCYFISSKENTMEISRVTGKITRLNSVAID